MTKKDPPAEYVLLGALMSGPQHGYEILQFLSETFGNTWYVATSQVYVVLKRLEGEGLVESSVQTQDTRPSKRVFAVSSSGKKAFTIWLRKPVPHVRDLRMEFMAKLYFFRHLGWGGGEALIFSQIQLLTEIKNRIEDRRAEMKDPFERMNFGYKRAAILAALQWLREEAKPFMEEFQDDDRDL